MNDSGWDALIGDERIKQDFFLYFSFRWLSGCLWLINETIKLDENIMKTVSDNVIMLTSEIILREISLPDYYNIVSDIVE